MTTTTLTTSLAERLRFLEEAEAVCTRLGTVLRHAHVTQRTQEDYYCLKSSLEAELHLAREIAKPELFTE